MPGAQDEMRDAMKQVCAWPWLISVMSPIPCQIWQVASEFISMAMVGLQDSDDDDTAPQFGSEEEDLLNHTSTEANEDSMYTDEC